MGSMACRDRSSISRPIALQQPVRHLPMMVQNRFLADPIQRGHPPPFSLKRLRAARLCGARGECKAGRGLYHVTTCFFTNSISLNGSVQFAGATRLSRRRVLAVTLLSYVFGSMFGICVGVRRRTDA